MHFLLSLFLLAPKQVAKIKKPLTISVDLNRHPSWTFGDVNAPMFDEKGFELPRWAFLENKVCGNRYFRKSLFKQFLQNI